MSIYFEDIYINDDDYNYFHNQEINAHTHRLRAIAGINLAQAAIEILQDLKVAQLGDPDLEDHIREELLEEYDESDYDAWIEEHVSWEEYEEQKRKYLEVLRLTPSIFHAAIDEDKYI